MLPKRGSQFERKPRPWGNLVWPPVVSARQHLGANALHVCVSPFHVHNRSASGPQSPPHAEGFTVYRRTLLRLLFSVIRTGRRMKPLSCLFPDKASILHCSGDCTAFCCTKVKIKCRDLDHIIYLSPTGPPVYSERSAMGCGVSRTFWIQCKVLK